MAQLSDYAKNDLFFHVTGVNIQEYHLNENIVTDKREIHRLIDNVVSIYEEKFKFIPVEEKLPEIGTWILIQLKNQSSKNKYVTMLPKNNFEIQYIKENVISWRYFL